MSLMYYTYVHIRPDTGVIFYVGKGSKNRAYDKRRNKHWNNVVAKNNGFFEVRIINWFNNEKDSLAAEVWLIAQLKNFGHLVNQTDGGDGLCMPSDEVRKKMSDAQKANFKNNPDKNPMKNPLTAAKFKGDNNPSKRLEVRLKKSILAKELGDNHHIKRADVRAKNSASLRSWHAANPDKNPNNREEVRAKKSLLMKGNKNPMYEKSNLLLDFLNRIRYIPYWGA